MTSNNGETLRLLIRDLHVGVLVQGPSAEILVSNPRALELLGLTEDQLLGRSSFDPSWNVIHEDGTDFPGPTHPVPVAIATRAPVHNVVMGVHRPTHDDRVWLLVNAVPRLDGDGNVEQVLCTFSDITARKQLEDSLRRAQRLESVGALAGGIAHDFNNLLTVISASAELARVSLERDRDLEAVMRDLAAICEASHRASSLTQQLLSFARKRVVQPRNVAPQLALAEIEGLLRRMLSEQVELVVDCADDIWPVYVDPGQLEQVLVNLAVNGRDAMSGSGVLRIRARNLVAAQPTHDLPGGDYVEIAVSDTGCGMATEVLEHIFEPFFTTKELGRGTGLGLATTHGIVRQAGGNIAVTTEPGRGSTFTVLLPRSRRATSSAGASSASSQPQRGSETILLVEDEPSVRWLAERILDEAGYFVLTAGTGDQAIELARAHTGNIDLLMTDVVMPGLTGRELATRLQLTRPGMRVLFVSGYAAATLSELGVEQGSAGFLAKPYTAGRLRGVIRGLLDDAWPRSA